MSPVASGRGALVVSGRNLGNYLTPRRAVCIVFLNAGGTPWGSWLEEPYANGWGRKHGLELVKAARSPQRNGRVVGSQRVKGNRILVDSPRKGGMVHAQQSGHRQTFQRNSLVGVEVSRILLIGEEPLASVEGSSLCLDSRQPPRYAFRMTEADKLVLLASVLERNGMPPGYEDFESGPVVEVLRDVADLLVRAADGLSIQTRWA